MQPEKRFFDVFSRYKPSEEKYALLSRGHSARFRYTKEPMRVEVDLSFDSHEDAELIYEIEDECRQLYSAESFKILPHFSPECFEMHYFDEIAYEAALCGAVTHGFFSGAKYYDDGSTITVSIPFCDAGVEFVRRSNAETILSNILLSRYGIVRTVSVVCGDGADTRSREWEKKREIKLADAERQSKVKFMEERARIAHEREEEQKAQDPYYGFEARSGISSATGTADAGTGETVEIDGITGATVTSKAVAKSVNSAVGYVTGADVASSATTWGG